MKKIKFLILSVLAVFTVGCNDDNDGQVSYTGSQNDLAFSFGDTQKTIAKIENEVSIYKIYFGTFRNVSDNHQVNLVFDADNSTAVEGVDFDVISYTKELSAGQSIGYFEIKVYRDVASYEGVLAKFSINSPTLELSKVRTNRLVSITLGCQKDLNVFPLTYNAFAEAAGNLLPGYTLTLTPDLMSEEVENKFKFKDLWGPSLVSELTGIPSYYNAFPNPGYLVIDCYDEVFVTGTGSYSNGGEGDYLSWDGSMEVRVDQKIFTSDPFAVKVMMTPLTSEN